MLHDIGHNWLIMRGIKLKFSNFKLCIRKFVRKFMIVSCPVFWISRKRKVVSSSQICSNTEIYSSHIVLVGGVISMQVASIWWLYRDAEAVTITREKSYQMKNPGTYRITSDSHLSNVYKWWFLRLSSTFRKSLCLRRHKILGDESLRCWSSDLMTFQVPFQLWSAYRCNLYLFTRRHNATI